MKGFVKTVVGKKGYGFIKGDGAKYFFHRQDFNGHWDDLESDFNAKEKIEVTFDVVTNPKGPRAANVRRMDWPNG